LHGNIPVEILQARRPLTVFERPRYFAGQLLTAEDLELEQRYHIEKRWLLNRAFHGAGVVSGLEVSHGDGSVTVAPGLALDPYGREIVVAEAAQLAIPDCSDTVRVCLLYAELETDRGTIVETYDLVAATAAVPAEAVVLSVIESA
jgi:hypothetical protein